MAEKSFVLLKPDAMSDNKIQQHIQDYFTKYNLSVVLTKNISLHSDDVTAIWLFTIRDPVCRILLQKHLTNKTLKLMIVEGDNALSSVCKIKSEIRKLYAKTFFSNCMHAPKDEYEYKRDIRFLFDGIREERPGSIREISFSKYLGLTDSDYKECAENICEVIDKNGLSSFVPESISNNGKYSLYLHNDSVNDLVDVAAAIYEFVPNIKLHEAYLICINTEIKGTFPLMCSNNLIVAELLKDLLLRAGVVVTLAENTEAAAV